MTEVVSAAVLVLVAVVIVGLSGHLVRRLLASRARPRRDVPPSVE